MGRRELALVLLIAAGVIALRAPLMDLPFERDEGGYAYVAWRMAEGEMPYRDWFEQKPPGIFLAYRAALALPLEPLLSIRLAAALACALCCVGLFALVFQLFGLGAALFAAVLLGFLSADPMLQGPIANTEIFMLPGLVAAAAMLVPLLRQRPVTLPYSAAVGALLAIATVFKPVAITNAPFFALAVALSAGRQERGPRSLSFVLGASLGGAGIWLGIVLWLWHNGALSDAFDIVVLHNYEYAGQLAWPVRRAAFAHYVGTFAASQAAAFGVAGLGLLFLLARRAHAAASFLGGFFLFNFLGLSASGLFFPHYFQQALPAVAALAAAAAFALPLSQTTWQRVRVIGVSVVSLLPLLVAAVSFWQLPPGDAIARIYPGNPFEVMTEVARELEAITEPDDRVFLFGAEPQILFQARRVSASRYIYLYPLSGRYARVEERRQELIRQVESARPRVLGWMPVAMARGGELEDWFRDYARESYRLHLLVVSDDQSRDSLLRVRADEDPGARLAGRRPWLMLLVRKDDETP